MSQNIEKLLDEALNKMKKGVSLDNALFSASESREELEPLLKTLSMGMRIPRKEAPVPARRRKFLTAEAKASLWVKYFSLSKFALMPLSLILIFAAAFTAEANPGQPLLYSLKTAIQRAPLVLIQNPTQRAQKEVELSEQNLNDAENFLNSNHQNSNLDASVIAQVTKQASQTVNSVKDVARDNAVAKNPELLNKLVSIAQKQEKLVSAIKPQTDAPKDSTTLEASKQESTLTLATVNKLVATVNEQVMANLGPVKGTDNQTTASAQVTQNTDKESANKTDTTDKSDAKSKAALSRAAKDGTGDASANASNDSNSISGTFIIESPTQNISK